mgnify:FL=1
MEGDTCKTSINPMHNKEKVMHLLTLMLIFDQHRNPDRERRNGRCPLTPEEVGLMLRALGFGSDSLVYVASGDVYGGEATLGPLKRMFPQYNTKEILASREELHPFSGYSSRLAAIDYIVCDQSDVFVTNNNGNMARILAGRRFFLICSLITSLIRLHILYYVN